MSRAKLILSRSALLTNYRILSGKVPGLRLLPMVKANAYGHDAVYTAKTFLKEKNLHGFGVATFSEAIELRAGIKSAATPILVFSDSAPWDQDRVKLCLKYNLQPVFSEILSLLTFQSDPRHMNIKAHVEVNTGMNRMGIPVSSLRLVNFSPVSVFTHLADADSPISKLTKLQMKNFVEVIAETRQRFPNALLHFSNSSAIWNAKQYPLTQDMQLARPGLSLYGIRPFLRAKDDGLKRAMSFRAPIINRIFLNQGDQVGYGGTYTCKKKSGEWIGVLAAGYADGLFRSLSGVGVATVGKKKLNLVGRVSMDLSAVKMDAKLQVGDTLELWGDSIDPYVQAGLAGTIPYELTTRIGQRLEKIYE
jgi:alanine racemase